MVLSSTATSTTTEIRNWINARVEAKFQRPGDLIVLNEFPRKVAGKTGRRDIKASYLQRI